MKIRFSGSDSIEELEMEVEPILVCKITTPTLFYLKKDKSTQEWKCPFISWNLRLESGVNDMGIKENLELMKTLDDSWNAGPGSPLWETFKKRPMKMSKCIGQPNPCQQWDDTTMTSKHQNSSKPLTID